MNSHLAFHLPGRRVHLGVCGSIAAYRAPDILRNLKSAGIACAVTLTPSAARFIAPLTFRALDASPVYAVMFDEHAAASPFAHLEPGRQAQAMLIAPASATTVARLAAGLADELLAAQALAFAGPLILAPAMNPKMWEHAATVANIETLRGRGVVIVPPARGHTACGEQGQGRLAALDDIHLAVLRALAPQDLAGRRVLITMGPTREYWDDLRYWTNASSGVMGACLAVAAWLRGAAVDAVCGPGCPWLPDGVVRHDVVTAGQMMERAAALWEGADTGIFAAAVADFRPEAHGGGKFKKDAAPEGFAVRFTPTADILASLAAKKRPQQTIVAFAAEADNLEQAVRDKLQRKNADLLLGNLIADGFGTSRNTTLVLDRNGLMRHWIDQPKATIAWDALSWLLSL